MVVAGPNVDYALGDGGSPEDVAPSAGAPPQAAVNAIEGPALWLKPRRTTVQRGEEVTLWVMAEDVANLMAAHVEIQFDGSRLSWLEEADISPLAGPFLGRSGGEVVLLGRVDQAAGRGILDLGVAGGEPRGVDTAGSDTLAMVRFRASARGTVEVALTDSAAMRDPANQTLGLETLESGVVVIE